MTHFIGNYVQDMVSAMAAATLAGENIIFISPPGEGKTAIAEDFARQLVGTGNYKVFEITPSTSPDVITGYANPKKMLEHGVIERVIDGTPFDPTLSIVVLDEWTRGNEPMFDAGIHSLNQKRQNTSIATANFTPSSKRTEAMLDRFAMWFHIEPEIVDTREIVTALLLSKGSPTIKNMPLTMKDLQEVQKAQPGQKAAAAISDVIEMLALEARSSKMTLHLNKRRFAHWTSVLYANSVFATGKEDFDAVPDDVKKILRYCWIMPEIEDYEAWQQLVAGIIDKVGAFIDSVMGQAYKVFKEASDAIKSDASQKMTYAATLGTDLASFQENLKALGNSDPRIADAENKLMVWFTAAINGNKIQK